MRPTLAILLALALAACDRPDAPDRSAQGYTLGSAPERGSVGSGIAADEADVSVAPAPAAPPAAGPASPQGALAGDDPSAPAMVIRTGNVSIEVDSLEPAADALRALARRLGGYVAGSSVQGGADQPREAMLELKVPAARFDEAVGGLGSIGEVESVNVAAQDVGEEFVDVTARVANARRLEDRLVDLLANRTGKLDDVLKVERELARVREEIERYDGRLRYLRSRVGMSTLSVRVHEDVPVIGPQGGGGVLGDAFRQAWRNFIALLAATIAASGVLIPLGAVVAVAILLARRFRPARPAPAPAPPAN